MQEVLGKKMVAHGQLGEEALAERVRIELLSELTMYWDFCMFQSTGNGGV